MRLCILKIIERGFEPEIRGLRIQRFISGRKSTEAKISETGGLVSSNVCCLYRHPMSRTRATKDI